MNLDAIVVGQGLAGTTLAWSLLARGAALKIVDPKLESASRVAAGLVTPVTGRALRVDSNFPIDRQRAASFYRSIEARLQTSIWFERPALRIAQTPNQRARLDERLAQPDSGLSHNATAPEGLKDVLRHAQMHDAARLDVPAYLDASRAFFASRGLLLPATVQPDDVHIYDGGLHLEALNLNARTLIWCRGYLDATNPWLPERALSPAKGEILSLQAPEYAESRTVHCAGHWLRPLHAPGLYSVGATYDHADLTLEPTVAARDTLLGRARSLLEGPLEMVNQRVGIRPVGADRQPVAGSHPVHRQIMHLNGLGSKGVLWAPREAAHLTHMIMGQMQGANV